MRNFTAVFARQDLRQKPIRGIYKRVVWRLRWLLLPHKPWPLRTDYGCRLLAAKGGAGALIYYQGKSEPDTVDFLERVLEPGMVFVDAGAHLREFSLLAATLVGGTGHVHAFEPQPDTLELLRRNIALNQLHNVTACASGFWHEETHLEFDAMPEPSISALSTGSSRRNGATVMTVDVLRLDRYFGDPEVAKPALIKIDVEGAELHVLRGAEALLAQPAGSAPLFIFEYEPANMRRFGYSFRDIHALLSTMGYTIYSWKAGRLMHVEVHGDEPRCADDLKLSACNLVASKGLPPARLAVGDYA